MEAGIKRLEMAKASWRRTLFSHFLYISTSAVNKYSNHPWPFCYILPFASPRPQCGVAFFPTIAKHYKALQQRFPHQNRSQPGTRKEKPHTFVANKHIFSQDDEKKSHPIWTYHHTLVPYCRSTRAHFFLCHRQSPFLRNALHVWLLCTWTQPCGFCARGWSSPSSNPCHQH